MTIPSNVPPLTSGSHFPDEQANWPAGAVLEIYTVGTPPLAEATSLQVFRAASAVFDGTNVSVCCIDANKGDQWRERGVIMFPTVRLVLDGHELGRSTELLLEPARLRAWAEWLLENTLLQR
jgi:hypothetical protein